MEFQRRTVSVSTSAKDIYHVHMALHGSPTTIAYVGRLLHPIYLEYQKGQKNAVRNYLEKKGKYEIKGEIVHHCMGLDQIRNGKSKYASEQMLDLFVQGLTPNDVIAQMPKAAMNHYSMNSIFYAWVSNERPCIAKMRIEWHYVGPEVDIFELGHHLIHQNPELDFFPVKDIRTIDRDAYLSSGIPVLLLPV